ncbi:leucyl/phenylalanyl-tRNA--protein transferase [Alkalilimnicola ehrlichii]|uniref:Leucyl/phenylalanyl-tRNA--protein transferase n=1 Tax=Alkalilimnicola ehrlichii TaxID=351052 RepID=A0A3E0WZP7_9GAMM|nr:leucyl/phenylalanyl-tRNA--protein transferase [Alkalilimnicola ehrlichii]RFA38561.1 leucyl/phenylalanyl-tRNA--protein transferase [Alkalilimnicola ehrlichii]
MRRLHWLNEQDPDSFPDVRQALEEPNGLLAVGGDLSAERLEQAYLRGIFPWYSEGQPVLWWSPDPRMVLFPERLRVTRSLRKRAQNAGFRVTFDQAFEHTITACAAPRPGQPGTWISDDVIAAYTQLHRKGVAHSVEVWDGDELAGGLYGVGLGKAFFGESMFSRQRDASKIALLWLTRQLSAWDYALIDCQVSSTHLFSLGAEEVSRDEFIARLKVAVAEPGQPSPWQFDPGFSPLPQPTEEA